MKKNKYDKLCEYETILLDKCKQNFIKDTHKDCEMYENLYKDCMKFKEARNIRNKK